MKVNGNEMFYEDYNICFPKGITIEDGVSIGPKILLDGRIGLASGSIVTKDISDYAIVAGIPSKYIGQREIKDYQYGYKG